MIVFKKELLCILDHKLDIFEKGISKILNICLISTYIFVKSISAKLLTLYAEHLFY